MTFTEIGMLLITSAPAVVAAIIAGTVALIVLALTHHLTRSRELDMLEAKRLREKEDAEEKRLKEFLYISTELIFRLEDFAQKCALVAIDSGVSSFHVDAEKSVWAQSPALSFDDIDGEWKSIPSGLLYLIRELPVRERGIKPFLDEIYDHHWDPPEHTLWFTERKKQYAGIGLRAIRLARRLRRLGCYPETRLASGYGAPLQVLLDVHRKKQRKRTGAP